MFHDTLVPFAERRIIKMKNKKVWFVTGCSKGLGHALVNELLEQGYMVSATSRSAQALIEAFGNESEQFLPLSMNLADEESVKTALKRQC